MGDEAIQVVVRCRPMNRKEKDESRKNIIEIDVPLYQVLIKNPEAPEEEPKVFTFNRSYDENTVQKLFYDDCCFNLVESVLQGFNGTIFAYGQTGCGKSHTMQGPNNSVEHRGVIPNSFNHIFEAIKGSSDIQYLIRCSYLEIYNEEVKDLLITDTKNPPKCEIKEDPSKGIYVKNLTFVAVDTEEAMARVLESGMDNRHVAATLMNSESSRSHSIFTIIVEMSSIDTMSGKEMLRAGKLNLVDLAGSERSKKTGATGKAALEGTKINLSLSSLGNVISSLADGKSKHIPYRDSKLTRLLQDSLGGNTKTLMIAAISPADYNYDETMSTLRYANRAKNIKNKPKVNEDPKDTMLREYKEEIEKLRQLLAQSGINPAVPVSVKLPTVVEQSLPQEEEHARVSRASAELSAEAVRERDMAVEALRRKEEEIAKERAQREELNKRLAELQSKLMGQNAEDSLENPEFNNARDSRMQRLVKQESHLLEREVLHLEVENKRKKQTETLELELEELKQALMQTQLIANQGSKSLSDTQQNSEKIMAKIKGKYDKKLQQAKKEVEDARDDFFQEQQLLLESLMEQRRDTKLLELICEMLVPPHMFKNILEFSKWDEESQEWIMPSAATIRGSNDDEVSSSNQPAARLPSIGGSTKVPSEEVKLAAELLNIRETKLSELTIPVATVNLVALPAVINNSPSPSQPHTLGTEAQSQSLPLLGVKSRPPSNYVNQSIGSLPAMSGIVKVTPGVEVASGVDPRAKSRKKEKRVKASPVETPIQTEESSVPNTAGPIADWGFSGDTGDGDHSPKTNEVDYAGDEDFETHENEDSLYVASQSKDRKKKRKKKRDDEVDEANRGTITSGFLPKL